MRLRDADIPLEEAQEGSQQLQALLPLPLLDPTAGVLRDIRLMKVGSGLHTLFHQQNSLKGHKLLFDTHLQCSIRYICIKVGICHTLQKRFICMLGLAKKQKASPPSWKIFCL